MKCRILYILLVAGLGLSSILTSVVFGRKSITVKGSDTMVILGQRWAEEFMKAYPDMIVQVTGGGSGTGIAALINGTTDIAQASRPMKQSERERLRDRFNSLGNEILVATDGCYPLRSKLHIGHFGNAVEETAYGYESNESDDYEQNLAPAAQFRH